MAVEGYIFEGSQDSEYESNPGTPTPEPPSSISAMSPSINVQACGGKLQELPIHYIMLAIVQI